jgi:hypothetical protein
LGLSRGFAGLIRRDFVKDAQVKTDEEKRGQRA